MCNLPRPRALTKSAQEIILAVIRLGGYMTTAARLAGVSAWAVYYWRRRFNAGSPGAAEFADFFRELEVAGAKAELDAVDRLRAGEPGWKAHAYFLERRYPQRWSRRRRRTEPECDLSRMSDAELAAHEKRVTPC
jgi:hypothetical protein